MSLKVFKCTVCCEALTQTEIMSDRMLPKSNKFNKFYFCHILLINGKIAFRVWLGFFFLFFCVILIHQQNIMFWTHITEVKKNIRVVYFFCLKLKLLKVKKKKNHNNGMTSWTAAKRSWNGTLWHLNCRKSVDLERKNNFTFVYWNLTAYIFRTPLKILTDIISKSGTHATIQTSKSEYRKGIICN